MSVTDLAVRVAESRLPARPIANARIALGIVAIMGSLEAIRKLFHVTKPGVIPFPYTPISMEPQESWIAPIGMLLLLLSVTFIIGFCTWISGLGLAATFCFIVTADQRLYSSHYVLLAIAVLLLTVAGAGSQRSIDSLRRGARSTCPAWPLLMLKAQLTIVYFFTATAKINGEFLSGDVMTSALKHRSLPLVTDAYRHDAIIAISLATIAAEGAIAFGLWSSRYRRHSLALAIALHASIPIMMRPSARFILTEFSLLMIVLYALCTALPLFVVTGAEAHQSTSIAGGADAPSRWRFPQPRWLERA